MLILGVEAISHVMFQSSIIKKLDVAVVFPEDEKNTKMVAQYISAMDSVKSISNFIYMDEKSAIESLNQGKVQVALVLPDNFYEDVNLGRNSPAMLYIPQNATRNIALFGELVMDGASLLQTAEAGVYAAMSISEAYQAPMSKSDVAERVSYSYIMKALNRNQMFHKVVSSPLGSIEFSQYYAISILLLFLLMSGLNNGFLYRRQNKAVEDKLKVFGLGAGRVTIVKILVMSNQLWIICILFYLGGVVTDIVSLDWHIILELCLISMSIAAYFHLIYSIAGNDYGASVLFTVNLFLVVCSGVLVPVVYLPDILKNIGVVLPLNYWYQYLAGTFFRELDIWGILPLISIIVIGGGIGATVIWKNT